MPDAVSGRPGGVVEYVPRDQLPRLLLAALHGRRPAAIVGAIAAWVQGAGTPECPLCNLPRHRSTASGFIVASRGPTASPSAVFGVCQGCTAPAYVTRRRIAGWLRQCGKPAAVR